MRHALRTLSLVAALVLAADATPARTAPEPLARPAAAGTAPSSRSGLPAPREARDPAAPAAKPGRAPLASPRAIRATRPVPQTDATPAAVAPARVGVGPGAPCNDARLTGAYLPEIRGAGGCGIRLPVRLTAVAGVALKPTPSLTCEAARALADWVETVAIPAAAETGAGLAAMDVPAGYVCRTVNHRPGGSLSEHARGAAIDISAFHFTDGRTVTVEQGWTGRDAGFLRTLWAGACGPFSTVLGPEADRWHLDHFHFDVAERNSGPVCR